MTKKIVTILSLLLLATTTLCAQGVLRGRVVDNNRKAVPYANIVTLDYSPTRGCAADANGKFSLTLPSDSTLTLRISFVGYPSFETRLRLKKSQILDTTFAFPAAVTTMDQVVIHGEKDRTTTFTKIEAERLEKMVGPNSGVENLIKTLPGVTSNNELSSQYSVRGGSFDENLVYINGIEVYRPMLIRSGQQEGMSIINPDLIDNIRFSPGGFEASYGDKMASVLDLIYSRPSEFKAKVSASLLGATASAQGLLGKEQKLSYSFGFRQHSNSYIFRKMETQGDYTTNYTDLQAILGYRASDKLDISLLGIFSRNIYGLIPQSRTTMFGGFQEQMQLDVYFDGQELDRYRTLLGALMLDFHPNESTQYQWITSAQSIDEREIYDIQSQYWLYQVNVGADPDNNLLDRGVGTYLEHARNRLATSIISTELKASHFVALGQWDWGVKLQRESVNDKMREWMWVDSAGYAMPFDPILLGDSNASAHNPILQNFCRTQNQIATNRAMGYVQRTIDLLDKKNNEYNILLGVRGQLYKVQADSNGPKPHFMISPRASLSFKPKANQDIVYKLAAGVYSQSPFYREYRHDDGTLNLNLQPQNSYQVAGTTDWNIKIRNKPFHLTTDLYYKYITNLVPYRIDNLRVRYDATNEAVAYATGLSMRLSGEFVPGLESWASLSLMKTQEDILGDTLGWLARPTDQRFSFKIFFQDYIPSVPFWRMSLNFIYASGLPYTAPHQKDRSIDNRLPSYFRIDWGNTVELSKFDQLKNTRLFQMVDDVMLSLEIFNLFNYRNVVSYMWVADYDNAQYHVPNFLTARQLNLKLTVTF